MTHRCSDKGTNSVLHTCVSQLHPPTPPPDGVVGAEVGPEVVDGAGVGNKVGAEVGLD
jgi:hypothetical protein